MSAREDQPAASAAARSPAAEGKRETGFVSGQQLIGVGGRPFVADERGALFDPSCSTLIVADLHLEKGSSLARRGAFLPPYDTRATLRLLDHVIDYYAPNHVIALGDSLHDVGAGQRIARDDLAALHAMQVGRVWTWVIGNHDPAVAEQFGGSSVDEIALGSVVLRHIPADGPLADGVHELAGHLHPAARLSLRGVRVRRPCFIGDENRLVLPAFGSFTGGLNVRDDAFGSLFARRGRQVWMCGDRGVYPVAWKLLQGD